MSNSNPLPPSVITTTSPNWHGLNILGRTYIDILKKQVAFKLRCLSLIDKYLEERGLKIKVHNQPKIYDPKRKAGFKYIPINDTPEIARKIEQETINAKKVVEYVIMEQHHKRLHKQQKELLYECSKLFPKQIWDWARRTKGVAEVGVMTACAFMNPLYKKPNGEYIDISNVFAHWGLTPDSQLRAGQQANFDPQIKGRLFGSVIEPLIKWRDPYYYSLYVIKKEYLLSRIDLLDRLEKEYHGKINTGWRGLVNAKAMRWIAKIWVSHAFELICMDEPLRCHDMKVIGQAYRHKSPIPPRPVDEYFVEIKAKFAENQQKMLVEGRQIWDSDTTEDKRFYFQFLQHNDVGRE